MSTSTVTNKVLDPSGAPLVGVAVRITLETNTAGQRIPGVGNQASTTQPITVLTDATGTWSVALTPNAEILQPTGTYYQVSEGGYLSNIVVPVGGGPYNLLAVQTGTPPTPSPQYLQSPATVTVDANGTPAGTRQAINLIAGTNMAVSAVDNPGAGRVDVTVTSTAGGAGPSGTVVSETTYGQAAAAGVATSFSRGDHTHGSPSLASIQIAESQVTNLPGDLAAKAPLASPSFTGTATFVKSVSTPVALSAAAANIATDANTGNAFRVTLGAAGPYVLKAPTNPTDGQMATWEIAQDATGGRVITLETGVAGGFAFGTDITSVTFTTTASKTDILGGRYNAAANRWWVIAFAKGY